MGSGWTNHHYGEYLIRTPTSRTISKLLTWQTHDGQLVTKRRGDLKGRGGLEGGGVAVQVGGGFISHQVKGLTMAGKAIKRDNNIHNG